MVKIKPFNGYRYDRKKVLDFKKVVAPPYDVINAEIQKNLHGASKYNVAHLTRGKKTKNDTPSDNEYTRASKLLDEWIESGALKEDEKPSIYVLSQEFSVNGERMTRSGFIALIELEELCLRAGKDGKCTGVHQHEKTLPKDIEDRLRLLSATKANFGLIFSIYSDETMTVDKIIESQMRSPPLMEVADDDGIIHRLWAIDDKDKILKIQKIMENRYIIIADGHHRYKTALQFSKEHPEMGSSKYGMLAFVNTMNKGLAILPTHRLIQRVANFDCKGLRNSLSREFSMDTFNYTPKDQKKAREAMLKRMGEHFRSKRHALGFYCNDGNYYCIVLKDESSLDDLSDHSLALRRLDVTILHKVVLERHLGITPEMVAGGTIEGGSYVEYIKAVGDAVEKAEGKVNKEGYQALFFMNPTRVAEVEDVATNHETMPQKSTFFYPKVYTGFVIYKL